MVVQYGVSYLTIKVINVVSFIFYFIIIIFFFNVRYKKIQCVWEEHPHHASV